MAGTTYTAETCYHGTLASTFVDTITISNPWPTITVINRSGTGEIYFTANGTIPTVGGDNTFVLPAIAGASLTVQCSQSSTGTVVNLIGTSGTTPTYSVEAI